MHSSGISRTISAAIIIAIVVIAAAGVYVFATPRNSASSSQTISTTTRTFKVALVSIGGPSTTWNEASVLGLNDTGQLLKNQSVNLQIATNLDVGAADAQRIISNYAQSGYQLVIGDSIIYESALKQVASQYPKVDFLGVSWTGNLTSNLSVYGWNMWEGYYPAGVVAALATKTNVLGFVTAFNFSATAAHYNAFVQGAKSVNPAIKVYYAFTGDWSDPTKGATAAQALISNGADVVAGVGDGLTDGAIRQAQASHVYAIGYIYDENSVAPNTVLTSVVWQKTKYFYDAINAVLQGNFGNREFNYGIANMIVTLAPYHSLESVLTPQQRAQVNGTLEQLYSGQLKVQYNPNFPPEPS